MATVEQVSTRQMQPFVENKINKLFTIQSQELVTKYLTPISKNNPFVFYIGARYFVTSSCDSISLKAHAYINNFQGQAPADI